MTAKSTASRYDLRMAEAWNRCKEFNDRHAIGSPVLYRPDRESDAGMIQTRTRSEAWALPSGVAVVMLQNKAGGVSIEHVNASAKADA